MVSPTKTEAVLHGAKNGKASRRITQRRTSVNVNSQKKRRKEVPLYKIALKKCALQTARRISCQDNELPPALSNKCCIVCEKQEPGTNVNPYLDCKDCDKSAHWSCTNAGASILKARPDRSWQCPDCKSCVVCCEGSNAGFIAVCDVCADAYHMMCHFPRIPVKYIDCYYWKCSKCEPVSSVLSYAQCF